MEDADDSARLPLYCLHILVTPPQNNVNQLSQLTSAWREWLHRCRRTGSTTLQELSSRP